MTHSNIDKAKQLARELRATFYENCYGLRQPIAINTEKFAKYVSEKYGIDITSRFSSELGAHLKGLLIRESKHKAIILIADSNNECWRRFVFVKEICHLFLDGEADYSIDAENIATALLSEPGAAPEQYDSELAAAYAALEIMIPDHLKEWMAHEANVLKQTPFQVAFKLKVPRRYVEYRMREWGEIDIHPDEEQTRA